MTNAAAAESPEGPRPQAAGSAARAAGKGLDRRAVTSLIQLGAVLQAFAYLLFHMMENTGRYPSDPEIPLPGRHFDALALHLFPLAAIVAMFWMMRVPVTVRPKLAAAFSGLLCLNGIAWFGMAAFVAISAVRGLEEPLMTLVVSLPMLAVCATNFCAIACAMMRAWRRARDSLSFWLAGALFAGSLLLPALGAGVPRLVAQAHERRLVDAIASASDADLAVAEERMRPWLGWTDLSSLYDLSRSEPDPDSDRAAAVYERLTGIDPRLSYY